MSEQEQEETNDEPISEEEEKTIDDSSGEEEPQDNNVGKDYVARKVMVEESSSVDTIVSRRIKKSKNQQAHSFVSKSSERLRELFFT